MTKKANIVDGEAAAAAGAQLAGDPAPGTDIAVGGIEATDIFGLGGDFKPQSSGNDAAKTRASCRGADGDECASALHDDQNKVTCTYKYCAAPGTISLTDLVVGKVKGGYHIDSISVAYSNTDWPVITVTGHNHSVNAHADGDMAEYVPSIALPCGFGCADLLANAGATSSCVSATYTLTAEHKDVLSKTGMHLAGDNSAGMETIAANYYGVPTLTTTGWDVTSTNSQDSNADFDTTAISATKSVTRS